MGPMTPTKWASLGLLVAGFAILLFGSRLPATLAGGAGTAAGLVLIGLSCLVDALLPGGSELTDEQAVMLRHAGIPYRPGAEKVVSSVLGALLVLAGAWVFY